MARMLGTFRQPPCKRCCGDRFKDERKATKRAVKRAEKAELRREPGAGAGVTPEQERREALDVFRGLAFGVPLGLACWIVFGLVVWALFAL